MNQRVIRAATAGATGWALSLLLAAPNLRIHSQPETYSRRYDLFAQQIINPFVRAGGEWDGDFMAYRILIPVLAHLTGLPAWAAVGVIWLAGLAALSLVFMWLAEHTSIRTAWLGTLAVALTPVIEASHTYLGYPDSVSWLIVMALILRPSPVLWAIGTVALAFNDERGLMALPLALAAVLFEKRHDWAALVRAGLPIGAAVVVGVAVAGAGRLAIASGVIGGAPVPEGVMPMGYGFDGPSLAHLAGLALAWKALWWLPIAAAPIAWREPTSRRYWIAVATAVVVTVVVCGRPFDFWRGLAALFPGVLLALRLLHEQRPLALQRALPLLALLMVALPQLEQMNTRIRWLRPLPVAVYEWQMDVSAADAARRLLRGR